MNEYPTAIEGFARHKFCDRPERPLYLFVRRPETPEPEPAILFFFGSGWWAGRTDQLAPYALHYVTRGFVCVLAEYRLRQRDGIEGPAQCLEDGRAAMRFLRENARLFNILPDRIIVMGSSAGGHVALGLSVFPDPEFDTNPQFYLLTNPVVDTTHTGYTGYIKDWPDDKKRAISPIHHLRPGLPPAVILHSVIDRAVPYENVTRFQAETKKLGNRCMLYTFGGLPHGFCVNRPNLVPGIIKMIEPHVLSFRDGESGL